jgi:hypothetical protein
MAAGERAEVVVEHAELEAVIARIRECAVSMPPALERVGVADGTSCSLVMHGGTQAACRLSWSEGYEPTGWRPMAAVVSTILAGFRRAHHSGGARTEDPERRR